MHYIVVVNFEHIAKIIEPPVRVYVTARIHCYCQIIKHA